MGGNPESENSGGSGIWWREEHRVPRLDAYNSNSNNAYHGRFVSEWKHGVDSSITTGSARQWSVVNVIQPLNDLSSIPDHIPIIIGCNKHEGV